MTDLAALIPGNTYRVSGIVDDDYIVLEGYEAAVPNTIYWEEFILSNVPHLQAERK